MSDLDNLLEDLKTELKPPPPELAREDTNWIVQRIPPLVRDMLVDHGPNLVLAGGFIRDTISGREPKDIDLFPATRELADKLAEPHLVRIVETENAYTIPASADCPLPIQIIHRWLFATPEAVVQSFDWSICQAAIWHNGGTSAPGLHPEWHSLCHADFYRDLAGRRLRYTNPTDNEPGGSLLRLLKLTERGFHAPLDSLGRLLEAFYNKLGVSESTAKKITEHLREIDPLPASALV